MRGRRRLLFGLIALPGAIVVLPAVAVSETIPTIEALNSSGSYGEQNHSWSPSVATVSAGGLVTFSNPSSVVKHGLEWTGASGQPTPSCSGVPVDSSGTSWHGECRFSQPGTYTFRCTVHPKEMTGTITVNANGTLTPTQPPQPGGGSTSASGTSTSSTSPQSGSQQSSQPISGSTGARSAGSPFTALRLPASQHGKSVHGSVKISQAGAGGRLEVALLARSASLARARRPAQVRVGRLVRSPLRAGTLSFAVPLNASRACARSSPAPGAGRGAGRGADAGRGCDDHAKRGRAYLKGAVLLLREARAGLSPDGRKGRRLSPRRGVSGSTR